MSSFEKLVSIMAQLRSAEGCPWDKEQTHNTLRPYLIEEAYEVLEALDLGDDQSFKEELGDLLLQVVFHAQIATEEDRFTIEDISQHIVDKLIRRHPHVFGEVEANTAGEVLNNWEKIKQQERGNKTESVLNGLPAQLPALLRAHRIQEKVAQVNFDWDQINDVLNKVREEFEELADVVGKKEEDQNKSDRLEEEMGDLLFSLVNVSRHLNITPEDALRRSNQKFIKRFRYIEDILQLNGERLDQASFERLDELWDEAKKIEVEG
jgi:tetrapyrrole methylase family protein/MazG family protein